MAATKSLQTIPQDLAVTKNALDSNFVTSLYLILGAIYNLRIFRITLGAWKRFQFNEVFMGHKVAAGGNRFNQPHFKSN